MVNLSKFKFLYFLLILFVNNIFAENAVHPIVEKFGAMSAKEPIKTIEEIDQALKDPKLPLLPRLDVMVIKSDTFNRLGYLEQYLENSRQGFELALAHKKQDYASRFKLDEAEALSQLNKWEQSKVVFKEALVTIETLDNRFLEAQAKSKFGLASYYNEEHEAALKLLLDAYEIYQEEAPDFLATTLANIALVYDATGEHETAIDYFFKSLSYIDEKEQEQNASITYYNIGYVSIKVKKYDQAEEYLKKSLTIAEKFNIVQGVAFAKSQLGLLEYERQHYEIAEVYLKESLNLAKNIKNQRLINATMSDLLKNQIKQGKTEEVDVLINQLMARLSDKEDKDKLVVLRHAADHYSDQGRFQEAIDYYNKVINVFEELIKSNRIKEMKKLQNEFNDKLQQQELEILKQRNELQQLNLEKQESQKTIFILAALILTTLLMSALIFWRREKISHQKYAELALTDELTGVPNRRQIFSIAERELNGFFRENGKLMFCLLDLDFFKRINDSYGHDVGDRVLIEFAVAIRCAIREHDSLGRIGGEEWLLILNQVDVDDLDVVFDRIRSQCAKIDVDGLDEVITVSMGVTLAHSDDESVEVALKRADEALYDAKHQGRNRYAIKLRHG